MIKLLILLLESMEMMFIRIKKMMMEMMVVVVNVVDEMKEFKFKDILANCIIVCLILVLPSFSSCSSLSSGRPARWPSPAWSRRRPSSPACPCRGAAG